MAEDNTLTAVQYGVGPIGTRVATSAHDRGADFIGAVDIDPEKVGADLGSLIGSDTPLGAEVSDDATGVLATTPDITFHSTVSSLDDAAGQLIDIMEAGSNVISTTEELTYPWNRNPEQAERLDSVGRENGVTCLGTGINPGFVMDTLPAVLTAPLESVDTVHINRIQDAGQRRGPLQEKVGAGLDEETFSEEIVGGAGHVGSTESIHLLAAALGWQVDAVEERIEPVIAQNEYETDYVKVESGDVAGVKQIAVGTIEGRERILLDLQMFVGGDAEDTIEIAGDPSLTVTVDGGYHGDTCTSAIVANIAPHVVDADAGLKTMIDIRTPTHEHTYDDIV